MKYILGQICGRIITRYLVHIIINT
ncbi:hypothetical protein F383_01536 [Gossypium arboreum]|uniref:Uncharacterized protein n=1 Tax=Gossypium arboreum TaxID=29729 RepID=A0A0B0NLP3_GOSAR|nr:hypothetical protein F383_01536 [Gossypium arboreum]